MPVDGLLRYCILAVMYMSCSDNLDDKGSLTPWFNGDELYVEASVSEVVGYLSSVGWRRAQSGEVTDRVSYVVAVLNACPVTWSVVIGVGDVYTEPVSAEDLASRLSTRAVYTRCADGASIWEIRYAMCGRPEGLLNIDRDDNLFEGVFEEWLRGLEADDVPGMFNRVFRRLGLLHRGTIFDGFYDGVLRVWDYVQFVSRLVPDAVLLKKAR